jgi:hypothetical protein
MSLGQTVVRRLAFIKYMFSVAVEQSYAPEPLSSISILSFHDAIELFLQLSSECHDVGRSHVPFMEYWELISSKLPEGELKQKESMRRLNKARVSLKHHGTRPSRLDIEAFRASATNFFEDNTPIVFGMPFSEISLSDFVQPESARNNLKEAESLLAEGDLEPALEKAAVCFHQMLEDYEDRKRDRWGRSPFFFGRDMTFLSSLHMGIGHRDSLLPRDMGRFVDSVKESLESIQEAVKILALGIDYRKYSRFKWMTPHVDRTFGGIKVAGHPPDGVSSHDVKFCLDFIVEVAVRLSEFDYRIELQDAS